MNDNHDDIDRYIRDAFAPSEIDSDAVERVTQRSRAMLAEFEDEPIASRRPTRRVLKPRRVLAVAAALATITTVAIAQPGPIDSLFGEDPDSAANRVKVLKEPRERHSTGLEVFSHPDEYPDVESATVRSQVAVLATLRTNDPAGPGEPIEDELRTFLDSDGVRVVGMPTTTGRVCYLVWLLGTGGDTTGSCVDKFTNQRPVHYQSQRNGAIETVAGVASDEVTSVTVRMSDGSEEVAVVGTNAFAWRGTGDASSLLVSLRDGTTVTLRAGVPNA